MKKLLLAIGIVLLLTGGWFLVSPLLFDTVVDEALISATEGLSEDERKQVQVLESLTSEEVETMPESERIKAKKMMEDLGQKMLDVMMDDPITSEPTIELRGTFKDADNFHKGSGTASIYTLPDGKHVLRFENFSVTNGPALSVYLVRSSDGDVDAGYLDLGKLKGNKGNQNYEIPEGTDLSAFRSVVIWCVPFRVTFTTAALQ